MKILLISMPWHSPEMPSIQIGVLKAFLGSKGFKADSKHLHLQIVEYIDYELYSSHEGLGYLNEENIFSYLTYPRDPQDTPKLISDNVSKSMIEAVKRMVSDMMTQVRWETYSLIGFSVTTVPEQLFFSVYMADLIKSIRPKTRILFGGVPCWEQLGEKLLNTFKSIDFAISGEGEITLLELLNSIKAGRENFSGIKGLIWRENNHVVRNIKREPIDSLDILPIPDYTEYFRLLEELKQKKIKLPVDVMIPFEGSRGCYWNRCLFCNHNLIWSNYRKKSTTQILMELNLQSKRYNINTFYSVDNVWEQNEEFWEQIAKKTKIYEFNRISLKSPTEKKIIRSMKKAGVRTIIVGVESFCTNLLHKMNKDTTAIHNIQLLKYCKEYGITPFYNILIGFPTETQKDIQETIEVFDYLYGYYPPNLVDFELKYGSDIHRDPGGYNIKEIINKKKDGIYSSGVGTCSPLSFQFSLKSRRNYDYSVLKERIEFWKDSYFKWKFSFFYTFTETTLIIMDFRDTDNPLKLTLSDSQKDLYLYCDEVKKYNEICRKFQGKIKSGHLNQLLTFWIKKKIMFKEGDEFLSLAPRKNDI